MSLQDHSSEFYLDKTFHFPIDSNDIFYEFSRPSLNPPTSFHSLASTDVQKSESPSKLRRSGRILTIGKQHWIPDCLRKRKRDNSSSTLLEEKDETGDLWTDDVVTLREGKDESDDRRTDHAVALLECNDEPDPRAEKAMSCIENHGTLHTIKNFRIKIYSFLRV